MKPLGSLAFATWVGWLVLSPALQHAPHDSFPLSTYPMFSSPRRETSYRVTQALAITASGAKPLPPKLIANREVILAAVTLRQAVARGPQAAEAMCRSIADRVSRHQDMQDVTEVRLVESTFDVIDYFHEHRRPLASRVHSACRVARPGPASAS